MATIPDYPTIASALLDAGLTPRGGFLVEAADDVPTMADGTRAVTLILAGNAGGGLWRAFSSDHPAESANNGPYPTLLDDWSRKALVRVADTLGGPALCRPLFPFEGPPFLPFVRWAQRAEPVFPSPVGPLIHPEYGLWHAYRGALAFPQAVGLPPRRTGETRARPVKEDRASRAARLAPTTETPSTSRDASTTSIPTTVRTAWPRAASRAGLVPSGAPGGTRPATPGFT